jgi:hypothetical protein
MDRELLFIVTTLPEDKFKEFLNSLTQLANQIETLAEDVQNAINKELRKEVINAK